MTEKNSDAAIVPNGTACNSGPTRNAAIVNDSPVSSAISVTQAAFSKLRRNTVHRRHHERGYQQDECQQVEQGR